MEYPKEKQRENLFILPENSGVIQNFRKNPDDKNETIPFKFSNKKQITHDTFIMRFELPQDMYLGINLGEEVSRKYTPISHIYTKGYFDLLIKVYHQGQNPEYPEGGKMSQWLDQLKIGEEISMRGPIGRLFYFGDGRFKLGTKEKPVVWREKTYKQVGMLCGGTGITPLYQLLLSASINSDPEVKYSMIFGNRTSSDILLKEELDQLQSSPNLKFELQYTIDKPEENWTGLVGYITKESIEKFIPPPSEDTLILLCGRGAMCKKYLFPLLLDMGYKQEDIFIF